MVGIAKYGLVYRDCPFSVYLRRRQIAANALQASQGIQGHCYIWVNLPERFFLDCENVL